MLENVHDNPNQFKHTNKSLFKYLKSKKTLSLIYSAYMMYVFLCSAWKTRPSVEIMKKISQVRHLLESVRSIDETLDFAPQLVNESEQDEKF